MKKKAYALLLALLTLWALALPAAALSDESAGLPNLVDEAGLLTDGEYADLLRDIEEISEWESFDVVIVTLPDLQGYEAEEAANLIYDENGFGYGANRDGVLLLISMEDRDWAITSTGWGEQVINEDAQAYLEKRFLPDLSDGNYAAAFMAFARGCEELVIQAKNGEYYHAPFPMFKSLAISLVISLVIGFVVLLTLRGQLKSVGMQRGAASYVRQGSLHVTQSRELFLYRTVSRRKREKKSSSSGSSSGHTSSSGKF